MCSRVCCPGGALVRGWEWCGLLGGRLLRGGSRCLGLDLVGFARLVGRLLEAKVGMALCLGSKGFWLES